MLKQLLMSLVLAIAIASPAVAQQVARDVDIATPDGLTLRATYFDPGIPGPGLLLFHQCAPTASRAGWERTARILRQSGFHVVTLDWRGFGDSDGDLPGAGTSLEAFLTFIRGLWIGDAEASLSFLRSRPGVDESRIGTMGSSCGMLMSLELAAAHPEIKAQVLVTGPVDDTALKQLQASSGLPRLGVLPRDDPSFEFMRQIEEVILPDAGRMFYAPDGAGHGSVIFDDYPELRGMVAHWLSIHLGEG